MDATWTRREIEAELLRHRARSSSSREYEAISFVMHMLADRYPNRNRIIAEPTPPQAGADSQEGE